MESQHGTELVQGAIYEFHKPDPGERIQVEIVFMHGLQVKAADLKDAYYKTWRTADGNEVWPETWLKEKYPKARILSLAYDSSARQTGTVGNMGPYLLGESLLDQMVSSAANIGQNDCPVVFVGHSLGGLIAKEIVVRCNSGRANAKYQNLLQNLKAVFFYATPHGGSYLADSWITKIARWLRVKKSSLVEYLKPEGTDRSHMHHNFLLAVNTDCKLYVVAEGRETEFIKGFKKLTAWIVRENSARLPGHDFELLPYADHETVCKPQSRNDPGYLKLIYCIDAVIEEYTRRITVDLSVDPIGIEGKINDISTLLERLGVSIVGLFGMGGVGKTTLSKVFYNHEAFNYAKSCYLENVKSKGVQDVQKELLRGLCGTQLDQHECVEKHHLDMIKDCFVTHKVLVVIDDVSSEDYLQDLQIFHALEIGSQSKVVVTGRDSTILPKKYLNSGKAVIQLVKGIKDQEDSDLELFLRYAFDAVSEVDKKRVEDELLVEAQKIVQLCNGLPLSLEVLGKYLGNSIDEDLSQWKEIWVEAYERLQKAQTIDGDKSNKLWNSLRISYDHLDDLEKKMFLDFACIFSEMDKVEKRLVKHIWDSPIGMQNLVNKSLLKVEGGYFVMHDQLRDMGRHILLKEALKDYKHPIYLWDSYSDLSKTYMKFKELTTESGVPYVASVEHELGKNLCQYSKLRLLIVSGCDTPSLVEDCLSQCSGDLRWLHLKDSRITKLGIQKHCSFGGLRVLQISYCDNIVELPQDIGKLINLVEIEVRSCDNLRSLPDSIGKLKNLKTLIIAYCLELRVVPDTIGELSEVEYLSFEGCHQLMVIDGTQICTQKLKELELPFMPTTSLCPCPQLLYLCIANGQGVEEFPQDFFKIAMPKLEDVRWRNDDSVEVVLKNPDGSELVLEKCLNRITELKVKRRSDGSISQLSVVQINLDLEQEFQVLETKLIRSHRINRMLEYQLERT